MSMKIDRREWWCDVCQYGCELPTETEAQLHGEMHAERHNQSDG